MLCLFVLETISVQRDKMDQPILKRIAEKEKWPPLNIYIYPNKSFPNKFKIPTQNPRWKLENDLPQLIKSSPVYVSKPSEADLFLVPLSLSEYTPQLFAELTHHLSTLGPYYDEYKGANHIFLHSRFISNESGINKEMFLKHPGHILSGGFAVEGENVKTWVFAKNIAMPIAPITELINKTSKKTNKIAVDVSTENCTERNVEIKLQIFEQFSERPEFDFATKRSEVKDLIESHKYAIITACENENAEQFFDAINALTIPIVMNNVIRFPFESELIDYSLFVVHIDEDSPEDAMPVRSKLGPHYDQIIEDIREAREMLAYNSKDGGYVWSLSWSLYMKLLSWLPIRRTKIIDNVFRDPNVFSAI